MREYALMCFAVAMTASTPVCPQTPAKEIVLHDFQGFPPNGSLPEAGLISDRAGNFYGTTRYGGEANAGVVFKLDASRKYSVLYNFTGGRDGANPFAGVIVDSSGDLYGTATGGGASNAGVVFKLSQSGQETVLYSFTGGADGAYPYAGVVMDQAGNLYGTTYEGGSGGGVVFKLDPSGTETVLHTFSRSDGFRPYSGVILDAAGNLYGTTQMGGTGGGVVYKIDATGRETVLHNFTRPSDGYGPHSNLTFDSLGNLYGTTTNGGPGQHGTVYRLNTAGQETILYSFSGYPGGGEPFSGVLLDSAGNLYGTTSSGGAFNQGTVYRLDPTGHASVLHSFTGQVDGALPYGGLITDSTGSLYGTTGAGGTPGLGVIFKLDTTGREIPLYTFPGNADGQAPKSGVTLDRAGNVYGTTFGGGSDNAGVVYKLNPAGDEILLHTFHGKDGRNPESGVTLDPRGNLYGTTYSGGAAGLGVVYRIDRAGHQTVLHSFTGAPDGANPVAGVIADAAGNLYGTTYYGGKYNSGTVYKLDPGGAETVLYSFTGSADGSNPNAGVILDPQGNLYGTTYGGGSLGWGAVYLLDPSGNETVLHSFTGDDGTFIYAGVVRDHAGNLYGTTGGSLFYGTSIVYKLNPAGQETTIYNFQQSGAGQSYSGVTLDTAGNLYGTTIAGFFTAVGNVYMLNPAGQETVLYTFTGSTDGGAPYSGVARDAAGNLYGTTSSGGQYGFGVVYKLVP